MSQMDDEIAKLTSDVTAERTAVDGAVTDRSRMPDDLNPSGRVLVECSNCAETLEVPWYKGEPGSGAAMRMEKTLNAHHWGSLRGKIACPGCATKTPTP